MRGLPQGGKANVFPRSRLADYSRDGHHWGEVCVADFALFASPEIDMNRRQALLGLFALPAVARVATAAAAAPTIVVNKTPTCGCCGLWVKHLQAAGFAVQVHDLENLSPIKERVGVPFGMGSCHTGEVGGYFVEGHVPAEDIKRLLRERPKAKGLTVPGMPMGSPGMEVPSGQVQPYDVFLVAKDGSTSIYAHHGGS